MTAVNGATPDFSWCGSTSLCYVRVRDAFAQHLSSMRTVGHVAHPNQSRRHSLPDLYGLLPRLMPDQGSRRSRGTCLAYLSGTAVGDDSPHGLRPGAGARLVVSVVVPARNEEATIERAIAPLLADPVD